MNPTKPFHQQGAISTKLVLALLLITAIAVAATQFDIAAQLSSFLDNVASYGLPGMLLFIALYIAATIGFVPASILTLGAGAVYGFWQGFALVSIASTSGAIAAFLTGRYIARDWVNSKIQQNQKFSAIDAAVGTQGWKIVLLTRLSPVFPFNLLNYAFGLTQVKFSHYGFFSWLGMLPGTALYVYLGAVAGDITQALGGDSERNLSQWLLLGLGLAATIAVTIIITRIASKAMREAVE